MAGDHTAAIEQADLALKLEPDFPFALFFMGLAHFCGPDPAHGLAYLKDAASSGRPDFLSAALACAALIGKPEEAEHAVAALETELERGAPIPPIAPAVLLMSLGRVEEASKFIHILVDTRD